MTRFAGRNAEIVGFDPMSLPEGGKNEREFGRHAFEEKLAVLEDACSPRADGGPERSVLVFDVAQTPEELPADAWMDPYLANGSPYALIGDKSAVVETLLERRDRWGLTYYVFSEQDFEFFRPVVATLAGT